MARRKKAKTKTIIRYKTKKAKKGKSKKRKSGLSGDVAIAVGGMGYGALREKTSNLLSPILSKVPAFDLADEILMFTVSMLLKKGKIPLLNKIPLTKEIGKAGMYIEAARTGSYLANQVGVSAVAGTSSTGNLF